MRQVFGNLITTAVIIPALIDYLGQTTLKGVHSLLNINSRDRFRGYDSLRGGLRAAVCFTAALAAAVSLYLPATAQNAPAPAQPAPAATPTPTPLPPPPPPPPAGANPGPGMPPGAEMPPPPPSPPTAADLKPGLDVTMPAELNVSGIAAIVNGQKISMQELVAAFIRGGGQPMLQELITKTELEQAAAKEHISVTPAEVDAKLATSKEELLSRGNSGQTWAQVLASRGLSEEYARQQIYLQLLVEKLAVAHEPFSLHGQIHVYHILIATTQLPFGKPPHSDADAKAQIEQIAAQIAAHKLTFQQAAMQYSEDGSNAAKGGDLGWVSQTDGLDPAFKAAAFALKEGQVSGPVKSQFGWHLIYVSEFGDHATPAEIKAAEEATLDQRARQMVQPYIEQLQNSANVENLLIPLPPKPKSAPMPMVGTPIPSAPLRAPLRPAPAPPMRPTGAKTSTSTPPAPPL